MARLRKDKFIVGDRIEKDPKFHSAFMIEDGVEVVLAVHELPESAWQGVGHSQWLTTDKHPNRISGAFFKPARPAP